MANRATAIILLFLCQCCCQGFDFTLDSDPQETSTGRQMCGKLRCSETLANDLNGGSNYSRRLTGLTISKNQLNVENIGTRWQQLVSITPQQPTLNRVSDGVRISGQLSEENAEIILELFKSQDCKQTQFSCVVVYENNLGCTSVTKSFVGKEVDSHKDLSVHRGETKVSISPNSGLFDDQPTPVATFTQLVNFIQMKLDSIGSRLDDSLKGLENRMEDKVGDLQSALNNVENRVEDKITKLHIRVAEAFAQPKSINAGSGNDNLMDKLDTCVDEVTKHSKIINNVQADITDELATVVDSVKAIQKNLSYYDSNSETVVEQCAQAAAAEDPNLTNLISRVSGLSNLTQNLVSQVAVFHNSYAGGALVAVDEFSDPLGSGKKEWKLVFRGTAYNNIKVYPAYVHGTGIPVEVEEGCKQFNRSLPCVNHYRDRDAFDDWTGIDEVLFAVYKDGHMVQHVVFNGKGSTYTNWFSAGRALFSSWTDLTTQPHNFFSMEGHVHSLPGHIRRFHINRDYNGGCNGFKGWFSIKDDIGPGCPVETSVSVPMFHFASAKTFAAWNGPEAARADAFGVFLKYE